jgi:hypothetical protein
MRTHKDLDIRLQHPCIRCNKLGRPLKRVWGYPMPGPRGDILRKNDTQGRIILKGCVIPLHPAQYECRHCGGDWRIVRSD